MDYTFSNRISSLQPSAIREILKFTSDPSVISFAAGNPSPEAFPVDDVRRITAEIMQSAPIDALQYGVTEGSPALLKELEKFVGERYGVIGENDMLIVTSGAQQVMDLAAKTLINEGDTVICEKPSFIGSLNTFRSYGAKLCGVNVQTDGMDMDELENALKTEKNVRFIYTIPNFQNPSGVTMSIEKRERLYQLAKKYNVLILEDNPYGDTRTSGEDVRCIKTMDSDSIVIYAGSFSKILSPGLRVGFVVAPKAIASKMVVGKQASDVHTPMLNQMIVEKWLTECDVEKHISLIREIYKKKLELMCSLIDSELGGFVTYVKPQGGLFIWCTLPESVDMLAFCKDAVQNGVAVVPGNAFLTDESETSHCFRLNFSTPTEEEIIKGMKILGQISNKYR